MWESISASELLISSSWGLLIKMNKCTVYHGNRGADKTALPWLPRLVCVDLEYHGCHFGHLGSFFLPRLYEGKAWWLFCRPLLASGSSGDGRMWRKFVCNFTSESSIKMVQTFTKCSALKWKSAPHSISENPINLTNLTEIEEIRTPLPCFAVYYKKITLRKHTELKIFGTSTVFDSQYILIYTATGLCT